jgi:hypothetical protein
VNVFFDVDHTLVGRQTLRPGAREAMQRIKAAGHAIFVWSAGGQEYVERIVVEHELVEWVDGCFDKDPAVQPYPDLIIDDDWYLVGKYGGYLVAQYREIDHADRELHAVIEKMLEAGHL